GKSRFIEALIAELRVRGVAIAHTACHAPIRSALAPIGDIIDRLFASADAGDALARELLDRHSSCLEGLFPRPAVLGPRTSEQQIAVSRFHLVDGLISLLCELAAARPLVLVFDDLHLADPLLLDFLWHLARRARRLPLRLLAAARPLGDDTRPWKKGLAVEGLVDEMRLTPLDAASVHELAAQRLGPARASFIARQLWSASGGHPLFVHQLLEELAERTIEREGVEPSGLPRTLEEAIRARLERLDEQDRDILSALAAAGREVDEAELEAVAGHLSRARVLDLAQRGLLRHTGDGRLDLAHAFLREALLEGLDAAQRRRWHQRWAEHLRGHDEDAVLLAEQSLAAAEGAGAQGDLLAAAEQLFERWQYAGAARFFQAALDRMAPEDPARLGLSAPGAGLAGSPRRRGSRKGLPGLGGDRRTSR
ncbi:MAG: hypothetical protein Q9Q13_04165, partial [Acidobacteriota bacterium]|nr:hypothetical protein [Acidobacteriota bacterium]